MADLVSKQMKDEEENMQRVNAEKEKQETKSFLAVHVLSSSTIGVQVKNKSIGMRGCWVGFRENTVSHLIPKHLDNTQYR